MKRFLAAGAFAVSVSCQAADSQQWLLVVFGSSTHVATFVEQTTMTRDRNTVTVWTNQVFDEGGAPNGMSQAHSVRVHQRVICSSHRSRTLLAATFFDAEGKTLLSSNRPEKEDVAPGTSTADLIDTVCNPTFGKAQQKGVYPAGDDFDKFSRLYFQTQSASKPSN